MSESFFVFDLDGTLISQKGRMHLAGGDWHAYNLAATTSPPVEKTLLLCHELQEHFTLVINTARPEDLRAETEEWLYRHGVEFTHMLMRKDMLEEAEYAKMENMRDFAPANCLAWFDDDSRVIVLGRTHGFNMLQVSE